MAITPLRDILGLAFDARYGVPAVNVFNDLTMEGVLAGAVAAKSPIIVQTSVKTVRTVGVDVLAAMWRAMTAGIEVPCALHLDHCPDRSVVSECLQHGWNSVLFDASVLPVAENQRQTTEVVHEAKEFGADVEGEIEAITGVEDDHGSDDIGRRESLAVSLRFIEETGIDVFAPSIGNAHGTYRSAPVLDVQRVSDIVAARPIPIALHGGSGLSGAQFTDLIARGCAKVNISTSLKELYMKSSLGFLLESEKNDKWDPPALFRRTHADVVALIADLAAQFGSAGPGGLRYADLVFDCDGVLADTERDGHRVAFNQTFREYGVPLEWSAEAYGPLLHIGGGKERLRSVCTPELLTALDMADDPATIDATVAKWHRRKTEIYTEMVASGALPARPGVQRIAGAALKSGWTLAVASTSAEASVRAVLEHAVGHGLAARFAVFAGDMARKKKPSPDIYLLAVERTQSVLKETVVIEDSHIGLCAATAAGLRTVVTVSSYTADQDFSGASLVTSSLGDPDEPSQVLADPLRLCPGPEIDVSTLEAILHAPKPQPLTNKDTS